MKKKFLTVLSLCIIMIVCAFGLIGCDGLGGQQAKTLSVDDRKPMYTVTFNANGGRRVESQQVEEGSFAIEPTTSRIGYTFYSWDYDFTTPITKNTIITAKWTANTDTVYKVEYYFENINDIGYTKDGTLTESLTGTTDTTATAEIKAFEHFTYNQSRSTVSGNINGDGKKTLKVYYTRDWYTLSNENTSYGTITNSGTYKYGDKVTTTATEKLGYEFIGWFNGDNLISSERTYTFTIDKNVTAKFKFKDGMSNFYYTVLNTSCIITGVKDKNVNSIVVPDCVTTIGNQAFDGCSSLQSVTIPNSVTTIGYEAFYNCRSLESIEIGSSVTTIGDMAFSGCSSLTSIEIPDSVTYIGYDAFHGCESLESIEIPDSVTTIGDYAFEGCSKLTSITIPNSVTSISYKAFYGCSSLQSVTIPNSVTSIGNMAFSGCSSLTSIEIPDSVTYIGDDAFRNCSYLQSVTIGNSVTTIGNYAFANCLSLEIVYWNATNCTTAGSSDYPIFKGCSKLTTVIIGDNVQSIPNFAFRECVYLASITIGNGVTSIVKNVFNDCLSLASIIVGSGNTKYHSKDNCLIETATNTLVQGCKNSIIPNYVTTIGERAFYNCKFLASIEIPNSVTTIGESAFHQCVYLASIEISNSVTTIGSSAFEYCSYLQSVTIGNSVTTIGRSAFYYCSSLTSIEIGSSVTTIGSSAFYNCKSLTSITIPSSVTYIGYDAFYNCSSLTSIEIGNSVTTIGDYAFRSCTSLTSIEIGSSVTSIGYEAFSGCSSLTKVNYTGTIDSWCKINFGSYTANPFFYIKNLYINNELVTEAVITMATKINNYAFGYCSSLQSVTIGNSVTTIGRDAFQNCSSLESIEIPDSVTSIGSYAFYYCTSLTSIEIPDSVTSIGGYAFGYCSSLQSVTIGNSVTTIGRDAFHGCESLESIEIGSSVTTIGEWAFDNCSKLTSITIPSSVTSIGECAFSGCSKLASITIPFVGNTLNGTSNTHFGYIFGTSRYGSNNSSVPSSLKEVIITGGTTIGDYAFYDCSSLESIEIGSSVTSIGANAFSGCSKLASITIPFVGNTLNGTSNTHFGYIFGASSYSDNNSYVPSSLKEVIITGGTTIGDYAFYYCRSLTSIEIGNSVTTIGDYAFSRCSSLTSIEIGNSVTTIGEWAFYNCSKLTSVTISNSVTTIGSSAFSDCSYLQSVTIGNSVTTIGENAFSGYSSLAKVNYTGTIDSWCEINFDNPTANPLYYARNLYINNELVTEAVITTATKINNYVFSRCSSLQSVTIGNSVTSICSSAFYLCSSLQYNEYDNGLYLGNSENPYLALVEAKSTNITSCIINGNCKIICYETFHDCSRLSRVYYVGTETQWQGIIINSGNTYLTNATRYYYSETAPQQIGNYWHYGSDGKTIVEWW